MPAKKQHLPLVIRSGRGPAAKVVGIRPDGIDLVKRLAANGNSRATIATALGISDTTLGRMLKEMPEVADAFEAGKGLLHDELVGRLLALSRDGNVTATIFASKALLGFRDVGDPEHKKAPPPNIQIVLPGPSTSPEEWLRLVDATPTSINRAEEDRA